MYIRNAQGQLVWVPPTHGYSPGPQVMQRHVVQDTIRNQMQREEWMRFNAPPPEDILYFHDQSSHFDGSVISNSFHNNGVASVNNSQVVNNRGGMMYRGQPPYNQMDPPIPRVIHSRQALHSPLSSPQNNFARTNSVAPSYRNSGFPIPTRNLETIKSNANDFMPDPDTYTNCMNTLFGSNSKSKRFGAFGRKTNGISCADLIISTSGDVEVNSERHPTCGSQQRIGGRNAFQCNGIRGIGKKFNYSNYSYEDSNSDDSESTSESDFDDRDQTTYTRYTVDSRDDMDSRPTIDSREEMQVSMKDRSRDDFDQKERVAPSNSSFGRYSLTYSASDGKKRIESHSSDDTGASVYQSFEQQSYIVDAMSIVKEKIDRNLKHWEDVREGNILHDMNDRIKHFEKSCTISSPAGKTGHRAKVTHDRHVRQRNVDVQSRHPRESHQGKISKRNLQKLSASAQEFVDEVYPSFDEPAELPPCAIATDQSSNNEWSFSSGEENRQLGANNPYGKNGMKYARRQQKVTSTRLKPHRETTYLAGR